MSASQRDKSATMPRLDPPETVRGIAKRLEDAGYETWCVGGAVRDALLGHPHLDWDLATRATPENVRKLFKRTVPVGIEFGTIGVLDQNNVMHEVTTFRRDVRTDGRHAVVEFGASPVEITPSTRLPIRRARTRCVIPTRDSMISRVA